MGSAAPLIVDKPFEPINRRIAIIVLKKAVADALTSGDAGITSENLLKMPGAANLPGTNSSPSGAKPTQAPAPKFMSPTQIDDAIDTEDSK